MTPYGEDKLFFLSCELGDYLLSLKPDLSAQKRRALLEDKIVYYLLWGMGQTEYQELFQCSLKGDWEKALAYQQRRYPHTLRTLDEWLIWRKEGTWATAPQMEEFILISLRSLYRDALTFLSCLPLPLPEDCAGECASICNSKKAQLESLLHKLEQEETKSILHSLLEKQVPCNPPLNRVDGTYPLREGVYQDGKIRAYRAEDYYTFRGSLTCLGEITPVAKRYLSSYQGEDWREALRSCLLNCKEPRLYLIDAHKGSGITTLFSLLRMLLRGLEGRCLLLDAHSPVPEAISHTNVLAVSRHALLLPRSGRKCYNLTRPTLPNPDSHLANRMTSRKNLSSFLSWLFPITSAPSPEFVTLGCQSPTCLLPFTMKEPEHLSL
jgi:hypothetical protein